PECVPCWPRPRHAPRPEWPQALSCERSDVAAFGPDALFSPVPSAFLLDGSSALARCPLTERWGTPRLAALARGPALSTHGLAQSLAPGPSRANARRDRPSATALASLPRGFVVMSRLE